MTTNEFRRMALSLPETLEAAHMGHPDFRVGGKIFATLSYHRREGLRLRPNEQLLLFRRQHNHAKSCPGIARGRQDLRDPELSPDRIWHGCVDAGTAGAVRSDGAEDLHAGAGRMGEEGKHACPAAQRKKSCRARSAADSLAQSSTWEHHIKPAGLLALLITSTVPFRAQTQRTLSANDQRARDI